MPLSLVVSWLLSLDLWLLLLIELVDWYSFLSLVGLNPRLIALTLLFCFSKAELSSLVVRDLPPVERSPEPKLFLLPPFLGVAGMPPGSSSPLGFELPPPMPMTEGRL